MHCQTSRRCKYPIVRATASAQRRPQPRSVAGLVRAARCRRPAPGARPASSVAATVSGRMGMHTWKQVMNSPHGVVGLWTVWYGELWTMQLEFPVRRCLHNQRVRQSHDEQGRSVGPPYEKAARF
jgi:hypothetical protein